MPVAVFGLLSHSHLILMKHSSIIRRMRYLVPGIIGLSQFIRAPFFLPRFLRDRRAFLKSAKTSAPRFSLTWCDTYPQLFDRTTKTPFDPHYIYHPAWAARILAETKPKKHVDIASILSFPTIVSAFVPVEYYDYRPADLNLKNLDSRAGNLHALPFPDASVESLSCMHTIEHVGLGRYGDPIDYDGDLKAMKELVRVLSPGGSLLFVVPIGRPRIEWNAHRIYSYEQILTAFTGLSLKEFSLIPDNYEAHGLIRNADPSLVSQQSYACGCFWFVKT
jgi:SAM-dependent methyltransferase